MHICHFRVVLSLLGAHLSKDQSHVRQRPGRPLQPGLWPSLGPTPPRTRVAMSHAAASGPWCGSLGAPPRHSQTAFPFPVAARQTRCHPAVVRALVRNSLSDNNKYFISSTSTRRQRHRPLNFRHPHPSTFSTKRIAHLFYHSLQRAHPYRDIYTATYTYTHTHTHTHTHTQDTTCYPQGQTHTSHTQCHTKHIPPICFNTCGLIIRLILAIF